MRTTLNKIRAYHPCKDGWEKLLRHLSKTQPDDEPLLLEEIFNSNGLDDALWCLRAVEGCDREIRLYAVWCARQVQHLMADRRSVAALDVAERYARGQASSEELAAAREAAREAFDVAAKAAAAKEAWATRAARAAAWEAGAAAWAAAAKEAWATRAARAAAWEAGAARAAAWEAGAAAWEAGAAAWEAAVDAQVAEFRRICREIDAGQDPYPMEAKS